MKLILRLRSFIRPYLPQILISLLSLATLMDLSLIVLRIIQQVIDEDITFGQTGLLARSAWLLFGMGLLTAGAVK
jgi:hypothetical protein